MGDSHADGCGGTECEVPLDIVNGGCLSAPFLAYHDEFSFDFGAHCVPCILEQVSTGCESGAFSELLTKIAFYDNFIEMKMK